MLLIILTTILIFTGQLTAIHITKEDNNVYIRSNKTGHYVAADFHANGDFKPIMTIPKKDNNKYRSSWDIEYFDDYIVISVHDNPNQIWDHQSGCWSEFQIGVYKATSIGDNNKFHFDAKNGRISVCRGKCVSVKGDKKLRSNKDCNSEKDKIFYIERTPQSKTMEVTYP